MAERLGLAIRIEPGLSEWLNVEWFPQPPDVLPPSELRRFAPAIDLSYRPRGGARYGESGLDALRRSGDVIGRLAAEFGGDFVVVGHGASVLGAAAALLGIAPESAEASPIGELPYGSISKLVERDGAWRLELRADTSHLRGLGRESARR